MEEYIKIEDIPFKDLATGHGAANRVLVAFASDIARLPTVEIVRCMDCRRYKTLDCAMSYEGSGEDYWWNEPDDYCSWGERKE